MKKLVLVAAAAALLSACGHAPIVTTSATTLAADAPLDAKATDTLTKGFRAVYMAEFTKLDANEDGKLDEYEGSVAIDVKDFTKADRNKDGVLTKTEFLNYATGGDGVFGFMKQSSSGFLKQARNAMLNGFTRLDKNKDRILQPQELTEDALHKVDMFLRIDALHVNVHITEIQDDLMTAADHTGDGNLSQAEWEDYCLDAFTKMLNPKAAPAPAADPSAPDPNDPANDDPTADQPTS